MTDAPSDNPSAAWSADELVPFGKYLLLDRLASGATAALYRGRIRGEAGFQRLVAIKRILPHMAGDPEFVRTFVREAKTAALLTHTNVCPIYELGKVGESLYISMECIAGKDLGRITRRLAKKGQIMPPVVAAWIAARLCDALDYAHNLKGPDGRPAGIVHRDLSPTNIVVSYEGQVKLIDFGLAKAVGRAQQTNVDALKQKLGYMSPEMVKGRPLDARSDVFGVGICLYEMLTSRRLFAGSNDMETLSLVANASIPPPSSVGESPPAVLEGIVMRALKRDPDARFASAAAMGEALAEFIGTTDPMFGPPELAAWMEKHFAEERDREQARLTALLAASNDAKVMQERQRFFATPLGAAALGKAEKQRRLSTEPPPILTADGGVPAVDLPKMPRAPSLGEAEAAFGQDDEEATKFYGKKDTDDEDDGEAASKDSQEPTLIGMTAAFRSTPGPGEVKAVKAPERDSGGFDQESTVHLGAADIDDMEIGAEDASSGLGFEEEATTIFFNTEEGDGGADQRFQRIDEGAQAAVAAVPAREAATDIALPMRRDRPGTRTVSVETPSPFATRPSNAWLYVGIAAVALLAVVIVARTPVGIALGIRTPEVGAIEVRARPEVGAIVKLDDVFRGQTPLRMDGVPAGKRRVRIEAKGFRTVVRDVHLPRGATAILDVALVSAAAPAPVAPAPTPLAPPPVPPPPPPASEPVAPAQPAIAAEGTEPIVADATSKPPTTRTAAVRKPVTKPKAKPAPSSDGTKPSAVPAASDVAKVTVNAIPWARLTIDGKDTGKNTPVLNYAVSPGTHTIRLETPDGRVHTETITVEPGETTRIIKRF